MIDLIKIKDCFDNNVEIKGTIVGEKKYGFNTKGGGWSKYKLSDEDTEAEFIIFRYYRKRKLSAINKNRVVL